MAGIALGLPVLALEQVLGFLVVVEDAGLPVLGRVASAAFLAVAALVAFFVVILAVARDAGGLHLQFRGFGAADATLVAGVALGILVLVAQGKIGFVMVEFGFFPVTFVMAALALFTEVATMAFFLVILLMAGEAFGRQFRLIDISLFRQVAGVALGLAVLTLQGIFGVLVMIEVDLLPPLVVVAGLALDAVTTLVTFFLVDLLVAAVTGQGRLLVGLVLVTFLALDVEVFAADQLELGFFVIEGGFRPLLLVVAVLALAAEMALVTLFVVNFLVAVIAQLGRLTVFALGQVAALALAFLVGAEQLEVSL